MFLSTIMYSDIFANFVFYSKNTITINTFIKSVQGIFRYPLVWNVTFPFIVGMLINYSLIDVKVLLVYFVWIAILSAPYLFFHKKILLLIPWIFTLVFGFFDLANWVAVLRPLSKYSMFVFFETNITEANSFYDLNLSYLYLLIPIYLITSIFLLYKGLKSPIKPNLKVYYVILIFCVLFLSENLYKGKFIRLGLPALVDMVVEFNDEVKEYKNMANSIESRIASINALADNSDEQLCVLVIGESTNRNHMSLYGYKRNTNPILEERDDILVYTDVISPHTHTQASVRTCLSYSNLENGIKHTEAPSIIDVCRAAGYETYWLSNQASIGLWDNLVALMANTANHVEFVNEGIGSREIIHAKSYDEKLIEPFVEILNNKVKKKLIVLHLIGTHISYKGRYPEEFDVFNDSIKTDQTELIDEYDNSILYNDFVVNSIIEELKKYSENSAAITSLVYFSDHGENVYDVPSEKLGHDWEDIPSRHIVEIPYILWRSKEYSINYPETDSLLKSNIHKAFSNANLFHSAIDLMHIQTDVFVDSLSLFNKNLVENERLVHESKISYENEILMK